MAATRVKICVVGALGRMGSAVIREAAPDRFEVTGAIGSPKSSKLGKSLRELGLGDSATTVEPPASVPSAMKIADVCVSFTRPAADVDNIVAVAASGKAAVIGTTGFSTVQKHEIERAARYIPVVMASNFSVGANMLFLLAEQLKGLPREFDISIMEAHHSGKADAPSGTAATLADIVSKARGYTKTVNGRSGLSKRSSEELEVVSLRGGGVPGEHTVFAFGPDEMLRLEHTVFSRSTFARGALLAAEWVRERKPGMYTMLDVLKSAG